MNMTTDVVSPQSTFLAEPVQDDFVKYIDPKSSDNSNPHRNSSSSSNSNGSGVVNNQSTPGNGQGNQRNHRNSESGFRLRSSIQLFTQLSLCVTENAVGNTFDECYTKRKMMQEGSGFSRIHRCRQRENKQVYVVKEIYDNDQYEALCDGSNNLGEEIKSMKKLLDGPYVVRLINVFTEDCEKNIPGNRTYMVMEEMKGGNLQSAIKEHGFIQNVDHAGRFSRNLLEAARYCHTQRIAHRDIRAENVLLVEKYCPEQANIVNSRPLIKLTDFGFAHSLEAADDNDTQQPKRKCLHTLCGTPEYMAPELYTQTDGYDERCDIWSAGVVVYLMLCGYLPFQSPDGPQNLRPLIAAGQFEFHEDKQWSQIDEQPKNLIKCFLQTDPDKRITLDDALECDWLRCYPQIEDNQEDEEHEEEEVTLNEAEDDHKKKKKLSRQKSSGSEDLEEDEEVDLKGGEDHHKPARSNSIRKKKKFSRQKSSGSEEPEEDEEVDLKGEEDHHKPERSNSIKKKKKISKQRSPDLDEQEDDEEVDLKGEDDPKLERSNSIKKKKKLSKQRSADLDEEDGDEEVDLKGGEDDHKPERSNSIRKKKKLSKQRSSDLDEQEEDEEVDLKGEDDHSSDRSNSKKKKKKLSKQRSSGSDDLEEEEEDDLKGGEDDPKLERSNSMRKKKKAKRRSSMKKGSSGKRRSSSYIERSSGLDFAGEEKVVVFVKPKRSHAIVSEEPLFKPKRSQSCHEKLLRAKDPSNHGNRTSICSAQGTIAQNKAAQQLLEVEEDEPEFFSDEVEESQIKPIVEEQEKIQDSSARKLESLHARRNRSKLSKDSKPMKSRSCGAKLEKPTKTDSFKSKRSLFPEPIIDDIVHFSDVDDIDILQFDDSSHSEKLNDEQGASESLSHADDPSLDDPFEELPLEGEGEGEGEAEGEAEKPEKRNSFDRELENLLGASTSEMLLGGISDDGDMMDLEWIPVTTTEQSNIPPPPAESPTATPKTPPVILRDGFLPRVVADSNKDEKEINHSCFGIRSSIQLFNQHSLFVNDSALGKKFLDCYSKKKALQEGGGFSQIYRCKHRTNKCHYVVKEIVDNEQYETLCDGSNNIRNEIEAMKKLRDGPFIVRLIDVFTEECDNNIPNNRTYMVMEEMKGGDLLSTITQHGCIEDLEHVRKFSRTLLEAIRFCHVKQLAHRDIKPENILFAKKYYHKQTRITSSHATIKITDFGFAKNLETDDNGQRVQNCLHTLCGTPEYVAPELYTHTDGYDERCDIWSAGVVIYVMLCGFMPFEAPPNELPELITEGYFEFPKETQWDKIEQPTKDLITSLLQVDPDKRASIEEALDCEWLRRYKEKQRRDSSTSFSSSGEMMEQLMELVVEGE